MTRLGFIAGLPFAKRATDGESAEQGTTGPQGAGSAAGAIESVRTPRLHGLNTWIALTTFTALLPMAGCLSDTVPETAASTAEQTGTAAQELESGVVVCDDSQYRGYCQTLGVGAYDWGQIHNDTISSLRVPAGMKATLYKDTHLSGNSTVIIQDTPYVGQEWNDQTSSIRVENQIRDWNCFTSDGRYRGRVSIWWGFTPGDADWACNSWISDCGNGGGCTASGGPSCDVTTREDGCSLSLNDPSSNAYKEIFHDACNHHDECYHAPWDRITGDGFDTCNNNFWNDMYDACTHQAWYNFIPCLTVRSVWADAMNFDPLRTQFWNAFQGDQQWVKSNCIQ